MKKLTSSTKLPGWLCAIRKKKIGRRQPRTFSCVGSFEQKLSTTMVEREVDRRILDTKSLQPPLWRDEMLLTSSGVGHIHVTAPKSPEIMVSMEKTFQ